MKLSDKSLKELVVKIAHTHTEEATCDECFDKLDCFAEQVLAGKNPSEAMPLIKEHLELCGDCREEFEALLAALKGQQQIT